jgi:hypothetical protein
LKELGNGNLAETTILKRTYAASEYSDFEAVTVYRFFSIRLIYLGASAVDHQL